MGSDGTRVVMEIAKTEGLTSIEYQLSYTSKGDIPRGVIGTLDVRGNIIKKEIILEPARMCVIMIRMFLI